MIALLQGQFNPSPKNCEILKAFTQKYDFTFEGVIVEGTSENIQLLAEEFSLKLIDDSNNELLWISARVSNWDYLPDVKPEFEGNTQKLFDFLNTFCPMGKYTATKLVVANNKKFERI